MQQFQFLGVRDKDVRYMQITHYINVGLIFRELNISICMLM